MTTKMRTNLFKNLALVLSVFMIFLLVGCGSGVQTGESQKTGENPNGETITLHIGSDVVQDSIRGKIVTYFAEQVKSISNGAINVESYFATIGNVTEVSQQLKAGDIDIQDLCYGSNFDERLAFMDTPMIWSDFEKTDEVINSSELRDYLDSLSADLGVKLLVDVPVSSRTLTVNKMIESHEDLKGVKIRLPNDSVFLKFWSAMGCNPVTISLDELYISLQQGLVEAQENPIDLMTSYKLYEVQKYLIPTNHVTFFASIIMNLDKYNALSDENKSYIDEAAVKTTEWAIANREAMINKYYEILRENSDVVELEVNEAFKNKLNDAMANILPIIVERSGAEAVELMLNSLGYEDYIQNIND